ncbi:L-serine ammonia-lyase, iron-sulfur-dependent, subunit alpha [Macrococcus capreoli]|uniref:L-serine ammonia-lyase, iron-sulfur-dependent, subunit alpha n=1 Tax=Macrococcus capreoli TaxID=2982690 RepID=UPI0021D5E455|nr:L-serine ammonia-lyase, iron-sulfur-dependent, subunit alpha [Macrococcus sp. TMW 2.2395]MCU7556909.1 L-serine ammonia-lyase, iron-sulfur-dependent, subunit alpha [Macrococcus sp. TMW 2.2395]
MYNSIKEVVDTATETGKSIAELMIEMEIASSNMTREAVIDKMRKNLKVMKDAVILGSTGEGVKSVTGLTGQDAVRMRKYRENNEPLTGPDVSKALQYAIATNEVNAAMGLICATPTAGSSGTIPGVLFSLEDKLNLTEEQEIEFLFTTALLGMVIANNASVAGAVGGCQAEVGSASAIAAAAAVAIKGGTPQQSSHAIAHALGNLLGLVCDPVAGLVEIPCVMRNTIGAGNALIAADLALAGIECKIPADQVIEAMDHVGRGLPSALRETGIGGLAGTPAGQEMKARIFGPRPTANI